MVYLARRVSYIFCILYRLYIRHVTKLFTYNYCYADYYFPKSQSVVVCSILYLVNLCIWKIGERYVYSRLYRIYNNISLCISLVYCSLERIFIPSLLTSLVVKG